MICEIGAPKSLLGEITHPAGYFALSVWKEKTTKRAFVVGLALPYILWGLIGDVAVATRIRRASAEHTAEHVTPDWLNKKLMELVPFYIEVVDAVTGERLTDVKTVVYQGPDKWGPPVATSTQANYALQFGKYAVAVSAPGYKSTTVGVALDGPQVVRVKLEKATWAYEFLNGAKAVVLPQRLPFTLP